MSDLISLRSSKLCAGATHHCKCMFLFLIFNFQPEGGEVHFPFTEKLFPDGAAFSGRSGRSAPTDNRITRESRVALQCLAEIGRIVGADFRELLTACIVEIPRDTDLDDHVEITGGTTARMRNPLASQTQLGPAVRAGRNGDGDPTVEAGNLDLGSRGRLGDRHGNLEQNVATVALEERVRSDANRRNQVTRGSAAPAFTALAPQPDLPAIRDPRRDPNRHGRGALAPIPGGPRNLEALLATAGRIEKIEVDPRLEVRPSTLARPPDRTGTTE